MRPSAQPFLWTWVLFAWEWKILFISKAKHLTLFWNRGQGELGNEPLLDEVYTPSLLLDKSSVLLQFTAVSRKVVGRNAHATIPKGDMGYDQYTVRNDWSCRTYFCCFPLILANICPWPPVPFFQISLKNSALKTTRNTFRDCRVHFFRQPLSKQL